MTVHLIKLCVGAESVEDLEQWIAARLEEKRRRGLAAEQHHTTRMMPRRAADILDGGSLYWVIKGDILCRQRILELRPVTGEDGIERCCIVLEPVVTRTRPAPRRPFQGWRYLEAKDAPPDLRPGQVAEDVPEEMRRDLLELGLI